MDLTGKTAVITGAASGIGRAIAERLVAEHANVVLADVDSAALKRAVSSLPKAQVLGVVTDVTSTRSIENLAKKSLSRFKKIHLVCNNAGVAVHSLKPVWEYTERDWQWLIGVNLVGVLNGMRTFVPILLEQDEEAHVVNTASLAAFSVGFGPYGAVKAAVVSITESLLIELRKRTQKIGVTCLCPGLVSTDIVRADRNRPAALRNRGKKTADDLAAEDFAVRSFGELGMAPATVAETLIGAIKARQFYVCTGDPPFFVDINERVSARAQNFIERKDPEALLTRGVPPGMGPPQAGSSGPPPSAHARPAGKRAGKAGKTGRR